MKVIAPLDQLGFGRYQIEKELGSGGMGIVYQAFDRERGIRVALKALKNMDAVNIYRLKNEFRQLADISHGNLVGLFELVCDHDRWFFTMELVEGQTFDAFVELRESGDQSPDASKFRTVPLKPPHRAGPDTGLRLVAGTDMLPEVQCDVVRLRSVLRQLAEGLHTLHQAGKLHRDVKPSNVMVTADGRVVVLDFGLASDSYLSRSRVEANLEAIGGRLFGTPAYVSPEQAIGEEIAEASDWYSVGSMLFEALTGSLPFEGTILEILRQKGQSQAPAPSDRVRGVPEDIDLLCQALLRRDPGDRPEGSEILGFLSGALRSLPPASARSRSLRPHAEIFVGRDEHLEELQGALSALKAGKPVVALIHGSSGIGKSALANHFTDSLNASGQAVVLRGRCYERESVPHKAFDNVIDALSRYMQGLPTESAAELLPRNVHALARQFPVLRSVPAVAQARVPRYLATDPHVLQQQAYDALKDLLLRITDHQALVIQIDDLQWGDADSARLLLHVAGAPNPPPILWVCAYRRGDVETSGFLKRVLAADGFEHSHVDVRDIPVDPLTAKEAEHLTQRLLCEFPNASELMTRTIVAEAEGVPFFIAELTRHSHMWTNDAPMPVARLSLDDVIMERVGRMSIEARKLLDVLAVAGRPLEQNVALRAASLHPGEHSAILSLSAARLVRTRGVRRTDPAEVYHDRVRETLVARMDQHLKRDYHRRIAEAIEAAGVTDPERVVEHHAGALNLVRAGESAAFAARVAAEKLAFSRAAELFAQALEMLPANHGERAVLLTEMGDALANGGRGAKAAEAYLHAADESLGREQRRLRRLATQQLLRAGRFVEARPMVAELLREVGLKLPNSDTHAGLGWLWTRARASISSLPKFRDEDHAKPEELDRLDAIGSICRELTIAEPVHGMMLQAQYLLLALRAGEPTRILNGIAWECLFEAMSTRRHWERRLEVRLERAISLAEQIGTPSARGAAKLATAVSHLAAGRYPEALIYADAADSEYRCCTGAHWERAWLALYKNIALEFTGDFNETLRESASLARSAAEREDRLTMGLAAMSVGNAHLAQDDPDACERCVDALELNFGPQFSVLHHLAFHRKVDSILYRGRGQEAYNYLKSRWKEIESSYIMLGKFPSASCNFLRAKTALATYQETGDRNALEDCIRSLRATGRGAHCFDTNVQAFKGVLAATLKRRDEAQLEFTRATQMLDHDPDDRIALYACYQLGRFLGGEKGQEWMSKSGDRLRSQGIRNLERWVDLRIGRLVV